MQYLADGGQRESSPALLQRLADARNTQSKRDHALVFVTDYHKVFLVEDQDKLIDHLLFHILGKRHRAKQVTVALVQALEKAVLIGFKILFLGHFGAVHHVQL